eukprot:CAMPEP_0178737124 /NCGR_PEP_ID=MMETSP0744-20121128/2803_1 /TAXON_ID=913974 /ORGANISM="Nitzschia punctata, Strain CCMP561" /LENGTH=42 /DNA_ID= /DNA_START= /DNA_END= /DNA_ORIENTATION=
MAENNKGSLLESNMEEEASRLEELRERPVPDADTRKKFFVFH